MIGLRRNKRGDMVLTINSYIDIDSTPDIQSDYFDCIYINTTSQRQFHSILFGASPILSYKCCYKPIFVNTAVKGNKEVIIDHVVDAYVNDMNNETVYKAIDKIKAARKKYGIKNETTRPTTPNQLFANILRYLLSRDNRVIEHKLIEKSSLGYINPVFEHYHSMGLFHLYEMFSFLDTLLEYGVIKIHKYHIKEHLCPKCNHSHLLYTECCPKCGSSNLKIQNIIHHFSCANVSPESTYNVGGVLVCPKCHKQLRHIGVDYDRPAVVYACNDCENSFTTPITKATCTYCEAVSPVNTLVPRDVTDFEITEEGIRTLTVGGVIFSNLVNIYDNFIEYPMLLNRLRRLLMETYRREEISVMVGKIWILNENKETVKIKDSLQGSLCRSFNYHKVSYNNNIFYVSNTYFLENEEPLEVSKREFNKELSKAIRKLAHQIEPGETICCISEVKTSTMQGSYDDFFDSLNFVNVVPDDYCEYSEEPLEKVQLQPSQTKATLDTTAAETEDDKILKRVKLYKQMVTVLITIASLLIAIAVFSILFLK